jgi:tape measure domain-containing protein
MARLKDLKVTIGLSKKGLTKLNADLRRVKGNFRRNFGEIAALAGNVATAIGTSLVAGLGVLIKKGSELQQLKVGFRSIMGGADQAAAMVDKLNKFTASTPFQLEQVSRSARQLIAVGVGVDDITDRMRMLGDIAAASGNQIEDIAAIFAKVQAKGKVDLEALNQLAERGIPIFDQLRTVTGDANMEFGAGSVKVSEFNAALEQMAAEGGFANDAMVNLSETVDGRLSTAMDNIGIALGEFAEKSGLLDAVSNTLEDFTDQIQRMSATDDDLVKSREEVYDITVRLRDAHKGNIKALHDEAQAAKDVAFQLKQNLGTEAAARHYEGAAAMYERVLDAFSMAGTHLSTLADAPAPTAATATPETAEEFKARFNAAAALREENIRLAEATHQVVVAAGDEAEALRAVNEGIGEMYDLKMNVMTLEEEQPLFDDEEQERIAEGTRLLEKAAFAAQHIGQAFSITSQLTEAAFANIKDKSQGFHLVVKAMLEDLLKKAIALAAAFGAIQLITGGTGGAALGGFKKYMMGGLGLGNIPQMAEGGLFTGMSLAMVGEGPGTSLSNPEVVAPLDKLQQMMGGGNVTVTGMIRGQDILISNERSLLDRNRVRGF